MARTSVHVMREFLEMVLGEDTSNMSAGDIREEYELIIENEGYEE